MCKISLDNGHSYMTAEEAILQIVENDIWDIVVSVMDDETRELVHNDMAPCTELEFLSKYLEVSKNDIIIG